MHILICDDDAAFGTRMAEYVAAYFAARSILVPNTHLFPFFV